MGRSVRRALLLLSFLLGAAGEAGAAPGGELRIGYGPWRAGVEEVGVDPERAVYPFAVSPEMEAWVGEFDRRYGRQEPAARLRTLQEVLFDSEQFPFAYDQPLTLTAAEAFAQRRGNCMAFTALFVALSRAMGLETFLVSVARAPSVEKHDDLVVVIRHVVAGYNETNHLYLFDFYLTSEAPYVTRRVVDDLRASAMFHTNLGGAAIRGGDLERARAELEIATRLDPDLAAAWVNLGVVRFRAGDPQGALEAYQHALRTSPEHSSALTNMAFVYLQLGQEREARAALRAAAEGQSSPFTLIALADVELARGNLEQARSYLRRARRGFRRVPEVYEAMARLERRSGDLEAAARFEERAARLRSDLAGALEEGR